VLKRGGLGVSKVDQNGGPIIFEFTRDAQNSLHLIQYYTHGLLGE
jgi:hypothetical protein